MADKFNIYDDKGKKLADAQPSPVKVSGLTPNTTYSGWVAKREDDTGEQEISPFTTKAVIMESFKIDNLAPAGNVGESIKLTLSDITPADTTNKGVDIWVDDPAVATVASNTGTTFTINFVKEGTTKVHWLAKDRGGAKADGTVTVSAKPAPVEDSVTPEAAPPAE